MAKTECQNWNEKRVRVFSMFAFHSKIEVILRTPSQFQCILLHVAAWSCLHAAFTYGFCFTPKLRWIVVWRSLTPPGGWASLCWWGWPVPTSWATWSPGSSEVGHSSLPEEKQQKKSSLSSEVKPKTSEEASSEQREKGNTSVSLPKFPELYLIKPSR